jgi:hypothetical protein
MLKHFTSQRCHFSVSTQNRIGIRTIRKYKFVSLAKGSLYPLRRLIIKRLPRGAVSETELIFNESTSLSAALLRAFAMGRSTGSLSRENGSG